MRRFKIVRTDNFGGDYPDEKFVEGILMLHNKQQAEHICKAINEVSGMQEGDFHPHHWKVVEEGYELQPGFEP